MNDLKKALLSDNTTLNAYLGNVDVDAFRRDYSEIIMSHYDELDKLKKIEQ